MDYKSFTELLNKQIDKLSLTKQLEFALDICKKLFVEYKIFSNTEQWGNPDLLLDAIKISENALVNILDISEIKSLLPEIDSVTPDTDDFGNQMGSYALNAAASVYETLEFLLDKDKIHIKNIATYYTDTIDFKIQEERELTEPEIDIHPLMVEARSFLLNETK